MIKLFGERNTATNALTRLIQRNSGSTVLPGQARELDPRIPAVVDRCRTFAERTGGSVPDSLSVMPSGASTACSREHRRAMPGNTRQPILAIRARSKAFAWSSWCGIRRHGCCRRTATRTTCRVRARHHLRHSSTARGTLGRDRLGRRAMPPLAMYQQKLPSYRRLQVALEERGIAYRWIRFEDLILDQAGVFEALRPLLDRPAEAVCEIVQSTKTRGRSLADYQQYYGREDWRDELEGCLTPIRQQLQPGLFEPFGYRL